MNHTESPVVVQLWINRTGFSFYESVELPEGESHADLGGLPGPSAQDYSVTAGANHLWMTWPGQTISKGTAAGLHVFPDRLEFYVAHVD